MPAVVTVDQVKLRLNKQLAVDDGEISAMIDAAEAEYASKVGPIAAGSVRVNGGPEVLVPLNITITAVQYTDGTVIPLGDLDIAPGIIRGRITVGSRNVIVDFTVAIPQNHREVILADVAGYFAATQRGNAGSALPTPGYEGAFAVEPGAPLTLFPRIRALTVPGVS